MKWLALAGVVLSACDDFDQLEEDALDAGRFASGGGSSGGTGGGAGGTAGGMTAGGSAGGMTAGGAAGGMTAGGTAGGMTAGGTAGGMTAGGTAGGMSAGGSAGGMSAGGSAGGMTAGGSGGGMTAGGSAGGVTAGGSAGGGVCSMACPPLDAGCGGACVTLPLPVGSTYPSAAVGFAATQSVAFLALSGGIAGPDGPGFSIERIPSGLIDAFPGSLMDLDARFGQALAVHSVGVNAFDGGVWALFNPPALTNVGDCLTGALSGSVGNVSSVVYCKPTSGGFGSYTLNTNGLWAPVVPLILPSAPAPDSSRMRPAGSNRVLVARMGGIWNSAWVPSSGSSQSADLPGVTEAMVASNETQALWMAATTSAGLFLREALDAGDVTPFPLVTPSITGSIQLKALAVANAATRAILITSTASPVIVLNQGVPVVANEAYVLTLVRDTNVFVTPLGTQVGSSWLGFTTEASGPVLHIVVNCTAGGSVACSNATGPVSRRFRVALP